MLFPTALDPGRRGRVRAVQERLPVEQAGEFLALVEPPHDRAAGVESGRFCASGGTQTGDRMLRVTRGDAADDR